MSAERLWVENWMVVGPVLEDERKSRLRALTAERALFLAEALFALPWPRDVLERRRGHSGLLVMQDLLRGMRAS